MMVAHSNYTPMLRRVNACSKNFSGIIKAAPAIIAGAVDLLLVTHRGLEPRTL